MPNAKLLETFDNPNSGRDYEIRMECPEFTSLCPLGGIETDAGAAEVAESFGPDLEPEAAEMSARAAGVSVHYAADGDGERRGGNRGIGEGDAHDMRDSRRRIAHAPTCRGIRG